MGLRWISLNKREGGRDHHKQSPPVEKPEAYVENWDRGEGVGGLFAWCSQRGGVGGEFVK